MATYSNILTWKITWTEEPGGMQAEINGVAKEWDMTLVWQLNRNNKQLRHFGSRELFYVYVADKGDRNSTGMVLVFQTCNTSQELAIGLVHRMAGMAGS